MTRAERRHRLSVAKAEARRKLITNLHVEPTPSQVGRQAAMHNTCPCWVCTTKDAKKFPRMTDLIRLHSDA